MWDNIWSAKSLGLLYKSSKGWGKGELSGNPWKPHAWCLPLSLHGILPFHGVLWEQELASQVRRPQEGVSGRTRASLASSRFTVPATRFRTEIEGPLRAQDESQRAQEKLAFWEEGPRSVWCRPVSLQVSLYSFERESELEHQMFSLNSGSWW